MYYKNKNWLQFLFIVKAAVLKQQISKFYPQIQRTEASDHIYFSQRPFINVWRFFIFSRWRPSAILNWFYACWDHPRRVLGGLCDCAKFGCNRCRNFDSMQILIFCTLSLKMPIHAPKIVFLGDFAPKMGSSMNETPKRHILGRKHVVWRIDRQNRSTFARSSFLLSCCIYMYACFFAYFSVYHKFGE